MCFFFQVLAVSFGDYMGPIPSERNVTGKCHGRTSFETIFLNLFLTSDIVCFYLMISLWYCNS